MTGYDEGGGAPCFAHLLGDTAVTNDDLAGPAAAGRR